MYATYKDKGLEILGFPCNQFGKQDPGSNGEIMEFCQLNYGVSFPMFGKVEVNGADADPLFKHLKKSAPGVLGSEGIKWNFTKFLIDASGNVVKRYAPKDTPKAIAKDIEKLLA
jgi:glutathione peroxidase